MPDDYQRENRARIMDLEKAMSELKVAQASQTGAIEALGKQFEQHADFATKQHTATNTGMQDLKAMIAEERRIQDERRAAEDKRRAELEQAEADKKAADAQADAAAAQANADRWATIRSAFTPQTIVLLISLIGALFGKAVLDQSQQAQLAEQVIHQYEAEKAKKEAPKLPGAPAPSSSVTPDP